MSTVKSNWPQIWKDQYNYEIQRRKAVLQSRYRADEIAHPKLWDMELTEENFFSYLVLFFPANHLIIRILRQSVSQTEVKNLLLSWGQVYQLQAVYPAYYSDREKIILLLNHYRFKRDIDKIVELIHFFEEDSQSCYWKLFIGLIFLDLYLNNLEAENLLDSSISHLGDVDRLVKREESQKAAGALLAFCYYMKKEFQKSSLCLKTTNPEKFHDRFEDLIRKVA